MKIETCEIEGLKIIKLDVFGDKRGFFVERFNQAKFKELGLPHEFVQDNHSRSAPGVLRGVHYQHTPPQGKLVGVASGAVWDVAVDVRPNSPTFGKYFGVELTGENGILFWMPPGFAHGFCVLGNEPADMLYKVTNLYNKDGEGGIMWNDSEIGIKWPISNPTISDRDKGLVSFSEYKKNPPKW